MEISRQQQAKRVCNTVFLTTGTNFRTPTWDDIAVHTLAVLNGMELELTLREVVENWDYPVDGNFDSSKYPQIDKTGIALIYGN